MLHFWTVKFECVCVCLYKNENKCCEFFKTRPTFNSIVYFFYISYRFLLCHSFVDKEMSWSRALEYFLKNFLWSIISGYRKNIHFFLQTNKLCWWSRFNSIDTLLSWIEKKKTNLNNRSIKRRILEKGWLFIIFQQYTRNLINDHSLLLYGVSHIFVCVCIYERHDLFM